MSNERSRFDVMIEDSCFAMPGVINIPVCMQLVYVVECAAAVQLSFDSCDRPTRILLIPSGSYSAVESCEQISHYNGTFSILI